MKPLFSESRVVSGLSVGTLLMAWIAISLSMGQALVPGPGATLRALAKLCMNPGFWQALAITCARASAALVTTVILALITGIAAGLSKRAMAFLAPMVTLCQSTPPILWITLLMVWVGSGSTVPFIVVTAALYPPLFAVVAQSTAHLPAEYFSMCRVHRIAPTAILRRVILPGIFPGFLGGFSFALGSCWKTAAVAEFFGSATGMGAQIYWAYRMLEMETLFAWALTLVGLGILLEVGVITPLKKQALHMIRKTP
ncbi:ABC transporter permease [Desulfoluna sp.]|uniref:ABC transporter permease n=1 Tax=Desulfoluna sp. TaxID=2045199 RepID=UPI00260B8D90|nr:ABC transporter permease subunit [Desulfoluna sp.]